ncbi:MAG: glycosyltransferase family 4 protein [Verrucomicrobiota bacterium]
MKTPLTATADLPHPRVLHFNSNLGGGGTDDHCVKLVQGLHRAGVPVWIIGPEEQTFSPVIRQLELPFLPIQKVGWLKSNFIFEAARLIRRHKFQIVHGHHGRDIWPTILASRLSGVRPKIVLTRHLAKSPASWPSRHFMLRQCDALIAISAFTSRVLREGVYEPDAPAAERRGRRPVSGDHSKIHVIHGGIDTERFRPLDASALRTEWGLQPGDFAFAMVGGYEPPRGKGQREFLLAAARVHEQLPHARFLIVGRGSMADVLKADIARLGLTGKAWLTPYCREMPMAMNAIDCLVHSQVGTEAFGLVLLEAFACGRPVIASALDGLPEAFAVGNHGQLVLPDSVDDLAQAMVKWAKQPALDERQRAALWERVARDFSLPAAARRVMELYASLIKNDRNP